MAITPAPTTEMTPKLLEEAIGNLFRMNNYDVSCRVHIYGAEIDIVAKSKTDQFAPTIYIEATTEYVNNTKYGKDTTKFMMVREKDQACICICISSNGFTADVIERAAASRIMTKTYNELFRSFEKFSPYVDVISSDNDLRDFNALYEEPVLSDSRGHDPATSWLNQWRHSTSESTRWLIILGEYGTGKTALTRILQYRWALDYKSNPENPIPFRIELRNFTRQFDATSLIHHFLDHNNLGHIPLEFVFYLMSKGRIILLLDGYDEMAQFLNARERRACLSALADLAGKGARGFLTSRPNYFTETEELRVFEALYASLQEGRYYVGKSDKSYLDTEAAVDILVEKYVLNRYERQMRDLTIEQTESLVRRKLANDPDGQEIILCMLRRIFRSDAHGVRQALSGKPVIISYLLELIDDLRGEHRASGATDLTEWQIYRMIVDRLMLRDLQRSPLLAPERRRRSLQRLAVSLSQRDLGEASEQTFQQIIDQEFRSDFRLMDAEERRHRRDDLFEDLRGSTTLTRSEATNETGWRFSHNSLREYLVAELFVLSVENKIPIDIGIPISQVMRSFVASIPYNDLMKIVGAFSEIWQLRQSRPGIGAYLTLLWDAICRDGNITAQKISTILSGHGSNIIQIDGTNISHISFNCIGSDKSVVRINASGSELSEVSFSGLNLSGAQFDGATCDNIIFDSCILRKASFANAFIFECDLSNADIADAIFTGIDLESNFIVHNGDNPLCAAQVFSGKSALGYLRYHGAITDHVNDYYVHKNHPKFPIIMKICERLTDQKKNQYLGLTQKGEAQQDPPFARAFVDHLVRHSFVEIDRHDLVSATAVGRNILSGLAHHEEMSSEVRDFLTSHS